MNVVTQKISILLTSVSLLWALSSKALAQQVWSGTGQIVSGAGEGGLVQLEVEVTNNRVKFLSGPSKDEPSIQLNRNGGINGTVENTAGTWQFVQTGNQLGVSFTQKNPYRIIRYRLSPQ